MDDRRPMLRLVLLAALLVITLLAAQGLVQSAQGQARLGRQILDAVSAAATAAGPSIDVALHPGGPGAWAAAVQVAVTGALADEAEIFDPSGARLAAYPGPAPVEHWPSADAVYKVRLGTPLTVGPVGGGGGRILSYSAHSSADRQVIVRLAVAAPDLVEDLKDRRNMILGHVAALLLLLLAMALSVRPPRGSDPAPAPALLAYEEAVEQLRHQGQEQSREHQAERQRLESQVEDRQAMARAGELTAGMVHEVRNGLGTILGYARLIERSPTVEEAADAARRIREECETLEVVVRRFMDFVKRETLQVAAFDLHRMLSRVIARESRSQPGAEVSLGPAATRPVSGDEELLERAFENLVRNARDAAGPEGRVSVGAGFQATSVEVTVSDDGPGLPAGAEKVRPFFSTKSGGLGLGLPLALKIVDLHGGEVLFHRLVPRGLTVLVRLPIAAPGADRGVTSGNRSAGASPEAPEQKTRQDLENKSI